MTQYLTLDQFIAKISSYAIVKTPNIDRYQYIDYLLDNVKDMKVIIKINETPGKTTIHRVVEAVTNQ